MHQIKTSSPELSRDSAPARLDCPLSQLTLQGGGTEAAAEGRGSAAALWPPLRRFIAGERRRGRWMAQRRWTGWLYEFARFGLKQGWACLFGGIAVALMIVTWRFYPADAPVARYDALLVAMVAVQVTLLASRLETWDELKVILIYHLVGTVMEIFKTSVGSWIYPWSA